jgi:transposase
MLSLLNDHFNAVAFRGLTRVSALRAVEPMSGNPFEDFAADTVWMTRLATVGELVRVPYPLYRKRYHRGNTHKKWSVWPQNRQVAAWMRHCLDMLAETLKVASDPAAKTMLVATARDRLLRDFRVHLRHSGCADEGALEGQAAAMIPVPSGARVWLAAGHTDMRRGFDGLALMVQETLRRDPHGGHLFVFRGRRGGLIKVLWHDGQGLCLFSKRLERGRFLWPSPADGVVTITPAQLGYLLEGIDWRMPQQTWRPQAAG